MGTPYKQYVGETHSKSDLDVQADVATYWRGYEQVYYLYQWSFWRQ